MRLEALVDQPVIIENDANAAAWGEFTLRRGQRGRRHGARHRRHRDRRRCRGRLAAAARGLRRRRRARPHAGRARRHPVRLRQPRLLGVSTPPATRWSGRRASWSASGALQRRRPGRGRAAATRPPCKGDDVTAAAQAGDPAAVELLADLGRWLGEGAARSRPSSTPSSSSSAAASSRPVTCCSDPPARHTRGSSPAAATGRSPSIVPARARQRRGPDRRGRPRRRRRRLVSSAAGRRHRHRRHQGGRRRRRRRRHRRRAGPPRHPAPVDEPAASSRTPSSRWSPSCCDVAGDDVVAVGIGAAGFVAADRATVVFAPHLSWRDEPLRGATCSAASRCRSRSTTTPTPPPGRSGGSARRGEIHLVMVNLGTGIGGGIVIDGQVMRGRFGIAGEFGHMQVVPGGHRCECGNQRLLGAVRRRATPSCARPAR